MSRYRILVASLLVALMAVCVLATAGCGGGGGSPADTSPKNTTPSDSTPKGGGTSRLIFFTMSGWSGCKKVEPVVNGLRGQYAGKVKFETMDLANFKAVQPYQQQYAVKYAPTVLVLDPSGKAVYNESPNTYGAELTQKIQAALDQVSKQ